jgi:hypothetical protein
VDDLGTELQAALRAIADQMTRAFDQDVPVRQSYFGTEEHSVCTYRIDETYTAAIAFGPNVRQGQVWYYLREAARTLEGALDGQAPPLPPRRARSTEDVFELLRRFFPEVGKPGDRQNGAPPSSAAAGDGTPGTAADQPGDLSVPPSPAAASEIDGEPTPPQEPQEEPALDDIDWDVDGEEDWSAPVDGAGNATRGMTLDQARQRGLIGDIDQD